MQDDEDELYLLYGEEYEYKECISKTQLSEEKLVDSISKKYGIHSETLLNYAIKIQDAWKAHANRYKHNSTDGLRQLLKVCGKELKSFDELEPGDVLIRSSSSIGKIRHGWIMFIKYKDKGGTFSGNNYQLFGSSLKNVKLMDMSKIDIFGASFDYKHKIFFEIYVSSDNLYPEDEKIKHFLEERQLFVIKGISDQELKKHFAFICSNVKYLYSNNKLFLNKGFKKIIANYVEGINDCNNLIYETIKSLIKNKSIKLDTQKAIKYGLDNFFYQPQLHCKLSDKHKEILLQKDCVSLPDVNAYDIANRYYKMPEDFDFKLQKWTSEEFTNYISLYEHIVFDKVND